MKFRDGDELLSMSVIREGETEDDHFVFTVTDGGYAKRTAVSGYRLQGRGGLGIKAMKLNEDRGSLVGGLVVLENDEVIAIKASGQITRSAVSGVPVKGRDTMGVKFVGVNDGDSVVVIALNPETSVEVAAIEEAVAEESAEVQEAAAALAAAEDDSQVTAGPGVLETGESQDPSVEDDTTPEQAAAGGEQPADDGEEDDSE
jgi:DNA gyrase subunit A